MAPFWQSTERDVRFSETDASGRVHFTEILKYVEDAEHAFLSARGVEVIGANTGWPRVSVHCDYRAALVFGDTFQVKLERPEIQRSSVRWGFAVFLVSEEETLIAEGEMTTVFVNGQGKAEEIGEEMKAKLLATS